MVNNVTTIEAVINGEPLFGSAAKRLDFWAEGAVNRFELVFSDVSGGSELITPNHSAVVGVNGVELLVGFVDDIVPHAHDEVSVFELEATLKGRGHGRDLADKFLIKSYAEMPLDEFMYDAIHSAGSTLTYQGNTQTYPHITYTMDRTFLLDGFVEVASRLGYDFTVIGNTFWLWALEDAPYSRNLDGTSVLLKSVLGALDNNILLIERAKTSIDLKNSIRLDAGDLDDDWTEMNAADYSVSLEGNELACSCGDAVDVHIGSGSKASIRANISAGGTGINRIVKIYLEFPLYGYEELDFSEIDEVACSIWGTGDANGMVPRVYIMDHNNREYAGPPVGQGGARWNQTEFKLGAASTGWSGVYSANILLCSWRLKRIGIILQAFGAGVHTVWFDGLKIAGVHIFATAKDAESISLYGERMLPLNRTDINSQVQLQELAQLEIQHRKNPIRTLNLTCTYQPTLRNSGYLVDVLAPGIYVGSGGVPVVYRILSIHSTITPGVPICRGHDAVTVVELVEHLGGVRVDRIRSTVVNNSQSAVNIRYGDRLDVLERSVTGAGSLIRGISVGSGGGGGYNGQGMLDVTGTVPTYVWEQIEPCLWGYDSAGHWTANDEVLELGESFLHFSQPDGHYLDVGLIVRDPQRIDNLTDPMLYVSQHLLVKKDLAAGGMIYSAQGALVLGHGLENKDDPPQILLGHSTNQYANKDTLNIRLAFNAGWGKLKCDSVFVDHIFKMDGSEWGAGLWNGGSVSNNILVSYANSPGNAPSMGVQSTNNQSCAFNLQTGASSPGNVVGSFGYDSANNRCVLNSAGQALRLTAATGGIWLEHDTIFNGALDIRAGNNEPLINWSSSAGFIRGTLSYYSGTFQLDSRGASSLTIASQSGTPIYLSPGTLNGTSAGHVVLRFGRHLNPEVTTGTSGGALGEPSLRWDSIYARYLNYTTTYAIDLSELSRSGESDEWPHQFSDYDTATEALTHEGTKTKYRLPCDPNAAGHILCVCGKSVTEPCPEHVTQWHDHYTVAASRVLDATAYMTLEHAATLARLTQQNLDLEERLTLLETQLTQTLTKKLAPPEVNN
jgi:hypothetical protein